jgi:hypothetical protein
MPRRRAASFMLDVEHYYLGRARVPLKCLLLVEVRAMQDGLRMG